MTREEMIQFIMEQFDEMTPAQQAQFISELETMRNIVPKSQQESVFLAY